MSVFACERERQRPASPVIVLWFGLALVAAGLFLMGVNLGSRVAATTTPPEASATK